MQQCETYRALVSALIDNEISAEERTALMEHIAECDSCRAYLNDQLLIHTAMQSMDCAAPAGFADSVMARVRETAQEHPEKKVIAFPRWKRFAGLAACCAVIVLGVFAMDRTSLSLESTADCAAPEMAYSAAQTEEGTATYGAVETDSGTLTGTPAETPEAESAAGAAPPSARSEGENADCAAADNSPAECAGSTEYAARLTTGSDVAAQWVRETLGLSWVPGIIYPLTAEEYTVLVELLTAGNEAFTETPGTEDAALYQLLAE